MTIGERIRAARDAKDWSQAYVARQMGLTRSAVSQWESDTTAPDRGKLEELAQLLDVSVEHLLTGINHLTRPNSGTQSWARDLPVLGAALGGHGALVLNSGAAHDYILRPPELIGVKDAFAVYMTGDSMEPRFEAGEVLYIHPSKPPSPRDYVLVEMDDTQAYIKRLVRMTATEVIAEQFNPPQQIKYRRDKVRHLYKVHGLWAK